MIVRPVRGPSAELERRLRRASQLVEQLVRENRLLRAENDRLARRTEQLAASWADIRRIVRSAPLRVARPAPASTPVRRRRRRTEDAGT